MRIDLQLIATFILSTGGLILLFCGVFIDPQSLNTAQTEFKAQTTYRKLRDYVWHREWENYQG